MKPQNTLIRLATVLILVATLSLVIVPIRHAKGKLDGDNLNVIKVACVGNSITYGSTLSPGYSYPERLQEILGSDYEVTNYGVSGATMLRNADNPYWNQYEYFAALSSNPDIVILMLGTNDSKPDNWDVYGNEFAIDAEDMINSFLALSNVDVVYVAYPPKAFSDFANIDDFNIYNGVIPALEIAAQRTGASVIDIYGYTEFHPEWFDDGVHPNETGALMLAEEFARVIGGNPGQPTLSWPSGTLSQNPPPYYVWYQVSGATYYYLWVQNASGTPVIQKWYTALQANCDGTVCWVTDNMAQLESGTYSWWLVAWNSNGYGPWSSEMSFSVPFGGNPGQPTLFSPSGTLSQNPPPYYGWYQVSGATYYYLWVQNASGTPVIQKWYTALQANCDGTVCWVTDNMAQLESGTYTWLLVAWNSNGYGPWSSEMSFSVP